MAAVHEQQAGRAAQGAALELYLLPHPLTRGDVVLADPYALDELRAALAARAPLQRRLFSPAPPDDLARLLRREQQRLARVLRSRARIYLARALLWPWVGATFSLLLLNMAATVGEWLAAVPLLGELAGPIVGTLGFVVGGPLLALLVALLPFLWSLWRARRDLSSARILYRRAGILSHRRLLAAPAEAITPQQYAAFLQEAEPLTREFAVAAGAALKDPLALLAARDHARALYRLSMRSALYGIADFYHELYAGLDALARHSGAVALPEEQAPAVRTVRTLARLLTAPFRFLTRPLRTDQAVDVAALRRGRLAVGLYDLAERPAGRRLLPPAALLSGALLFGLVFLGLGLYYTGPNEVVVRVPLGQAAVPRDVTALGAGERVVREPGLHWGLPAPFEQRIHVPLERLRGEFTIPFRRLSESVGLVIVVDAELRVVQQETWIAYFSRARGDPFARLNERVASAVQQTIQARRSDLEQALLRENPALANNRQELRDQVDARLADHLAEIIAEAFDQLNASGLARDTGVELVETFTYRLVPARI
jgi:hypothetical protein